MIPGRVSIYVATEPLDLRRSFDGLAAVVREVLRQDPLLCVVVRYVARRRSVRGATRAPPRSLRKIPTHFLRRSPGSGAPRPSVGSGLHNLP
ncbi:IS66 family insertion sequence element accessory protein TnpB [Sorangium sp. So ce381]|uniref:IS66 family insertion sequence element accessory protein TnpB n=1 Tax=Sorangium sp. So ce381 TaxID=3133307 RepID=UPI003F5B59BF